MKLGLTALLVRCSILVGCTQELPVYRGETQARDGLIYAVNITEPLTVGLEKFKDDDSQWGRQQLIERISMTASPG